MEEQACITHSIEAKTGVNSMSCDNIPYFEDS